MSSISEIISTDLAEYGEIKDQIKAIKKFVSKLEVKEGKKFELKKFKTNISNKPFEKVEGELLLELGLKALSVFQDKFYAEGKRSFLIVLQAMDAAGKDGAIKYVMGGLNPQGVRVTSFKVPSKEELSHDFLWRHYKALPTKGEIGIFNRSHYENVLVTRVHPEYILNEHIPGIDSVDDVNEKFWENRFKHINHFEKTLTDSGTVILKFFLHVSKDIQKERLLERIEEKGKNWKFSSGDLAERKLWDNYMSAYEQMISATSTKEAPWFVLPADDKWFARLCMSTIIQNCFDDMDPKYPKLNLFEEAEILKCRELLLKD